MRKGETGQAFILVLILLAIGALLIVPALRLTGTSLKSSQILARHVRAMYAADGAQEYVLWKLAYEPDYAASFTVEGQSDNFSVDICGKQVDVNVVMRAVPGQGGMTLATDEVIRPTKTVTPHTVSNGYPGPYTYTIKLEQLSENTTQGLDAVYDVLPKGLEYVADSSRLSVDGGEWTDNIGEPRIDTIGGQDRLRWPYSDNFTSPMRVFAVRQVKEISFETTGSLLNNRMYYNWVLLKVGDVNTLSGPTANITLGEGSLPVGGLLAANKTSYPEVIQPGVETDVEYTIRITNLDGLTHQIQEVTDYLPPGFYYSDNSTSGITTIEPQGKGETVNINGVNREVLLWTTAEFPQGNAVDISAGETLSLTFRAQTTKDVSGSYYNEVTVVPKTPIPSIFQPDDMDVTNEDFNITYSWNTGMVIVPAYDSQTDAGDVYIDANMALTLDSISITSWQIY